MKNWKQWIAAAGFLLMQFPAAAQRKSPAVHSSLNNGVERPAVVIGLVVDQMRWDYLYRFYNRYGSGGWKRLLNGGFRFENAFIPYAKCVTAAGHATIYTGTYPALHGIVGNDFIDQQTGVKSYCSDDTTVQPVGTASKGERMSPRNLLTNTVGDELRLATNFKSRVFGIALKDRGAIFPAGHAANAAYWYDESTGKWVTSSWYMANLPLWVDAYNGQRKPDSLMRIDWTPMLADSLYDQSAPENNLFEKPLNHEKQTTFPHVYRDQVGKNYDAFQESPYGNWITLDFARQLIRSEQVGQSGQTDMLCISLSSIDKVAHLSGPQSKEMEDMFIRLDRDLADFFQFLDQQYGANNYLIFLSADHGAPQAPAFLEEHQLPAGNVSSGKIKEELNAFCEANFQLKNAVRTVMVYDVYLNHPHLDTLPIDQQLLKKAMVAYLEKRPGIFAAYDFSQLSETRFPAILRDRIVNGYYAKRSGDLQYIVNNHYLYSAKPTGTEHGAWYNYDAHIPLIWYGWHIPKGRSYRTVYMTDIAVTLAALLQIQMPAAAVGSVLPEVVR